MWPVEAVPCLFVILANLVDLVVALLRAALDSVELVKDLRVEASLDKGQISLTSLVSCCSPFCKAFGSRGTGFDELARFC